MNLEKQIANKRSLILLCDKERFYVERRETLLRLNNYTSRDEIRQSPITGEWYQWWDKEATPS